MSLPDLLAAISSLGGYFAIASMAAVIITTVIDWLIQPDNSTIMEAITGLSVFVFFIGAVLYAGANIAALFLLAHRG